MFSSEASRRLHKWEGFSCIVLFLSPTNFTNISFVPNNPETNKEDNDIQETEIIPEGHGARNIVLNIRKGH